MTTAASFSNWGAYDRYRGAGRRTEERGVHGRHRTTNRIGAGTSFAAPLVAAAAGLLWSYKPALTLSEVRDALRAPRRLCPQLHACRWCGWTSRRRWTPSSRRWSPPPAASPWPRTASLALCRRKPTLSVALVQPKDVVRAQYTLDLPPYNDGGAADVVVQSSTAPDFAATLTVPTADNYRGATARGVLQQHRYAGAPFTVQVYVFNQRGDVNADGVVDLLGPGRLCPGAGRACAGTPGYSPFFDSDLERHDQRELDASAVGYFFNGVAAVSGRCTASPPQDGYTGEEVTFGADGQRAGAAELRLGLRRRGDAQYVAAPSRPRSRSARKARTTPASR